MFLPCLQIQNDKTVLLSFAFVGYLRILFPDTQGWRQKGQTRISSDHSVDSPISAPVDSIADFWDKIQDRYFFPDLV